MSKMYSNIRLFSQSLGRAAACLAIALFICFSIASNSVQGQTMSGYAFAPTSGTFNPLSGATVQKVAGGGNFSLLSDSGTNPIAGIFKGVTGISAKPAAGQNYTFASLANANLEVTMSAAPNPVTAGSNVTYGITLVNIGPNAAANFSLQDIMPSGTTFVSMTQIDGPSLACTKPAVDTNGTINCTIASFPAQGTANFKLVIRVNNTFGPGTNLTNTVTASSSTPDSNSANNSATTTITVNLTPSLNLTVTRTDDRNNPTCAANDCSLREAIKQTNATSSVDTIQFSPLFDSPKTITLTNGELTISNSVTINGKGANLTTVSGDNKSRVFATVGQNFSMTTTISGLTIANGNSGDYPNEGGGMTNDSYGTINLINCAFINNNSSNNGGGLNRGSYGTWNITGCTFSGNTAYDGGAIYISDANTNITNTTISGNTATGPEQGAFMPQGGGIYNDYGKLTITNSTITGNTATGSGSTGGVYQDSAFGNASTTVKNSIIAGNTGAFPDVKSSVSFISNGYNFIGKSNGSTGFTNGVKQDQVGTIAAPKDPMLLPLANNGGTTQTHALSGGSPALDKGSATGTDQRGSNRPVDLANATYPNATGGNGADIGAFEAQTAPAAVSPDLIVMKTHGGNFTRGDTGKTYTITVRNIGNGLTSGNVSVVDRLPSGLTVTDMTGTGWNCPPATLRCSRNDALLPNTAYPPITLTVTVANNAPASVTNVVDVSGGGDTSSGNNQAIDPTTILTSDLTVRKTHTDIFARGDTVKLYTIVVTNSGNGATSGMVTVEDTLPAGLTAIGMSGTGWNCNHLLPKPTCTRSDVLFPGSSYPPITLGVSIATDAPASVTNTANVSGGSETNTGNNSTSDQTTILTSDLTVTKTHTDIFTQGDTGKLYKIVVSNSGNASTSGKVTVTDTLPAGLTAVTAMTGTGWTCAPLPALSCNRSNPLAPVSSYPAITLTVTVAPNAAASVTNTATVSGGSETNTANNQASDPTTINAAPVPAGNILISEFRTHGALGADDEFIELYNNTNAPISMGGYALVTKAGAGSLNAPATLVVLQPGASIPARGHYLLRKAGAGNYSLGTYAQADQTYAGAIGDSDGIALFSNGSIFNASTLLDAVGFSGVSDALYREGVGLDPASGITDDGQYSFVRRVTATGLQDTTDNNADFIFVSNTGGTFSGKTSVLGAPGPENSFSPISRTAQFSVQLIEPNFDSITAPNRVRNPAQTALIEAPNAGTIEFRQRWLNNTGVAVTSLRFRIVDTTTKNSVLIFPSQADLRNVSSTDFSVVTSRGNLLIKGLTLQSPSDQGTTGGGHNSSLTVALPAGGLAPGEAINVNFLLGVKTGGSFRFDIFIEALP